MAEDPSSRLRSYLDTFLDAFKHYVVTICEYGLLRRSDVQILDTNTWKLCPVKMSGEPLYPRPYHSACLFDTNKIIIFGGLLDGEQSSDDVIIMELHDEEGGKDHILMIMLS